MMEEIYMKARITISVIWGIFAVMFISLATWHFHASRQHIPQLQIAELVPGGKALAVADLTGEAVDVEAPVREFIDKFNDYLASQDKSNQTMNQIAAFGYFLACLASLVSLLLEWREEFEQEH